MNTVHAGNTHVGMGFWVHCINGGNENVSNLHDRTSVYMTRTVLKGKTLSGTLTHIHNVDNLCDIYTQQQTKHERGPSTEVIAPSLPLKSDMDVPFKPPALLLTGLIPPPQWWIRGIRNPSICMANYL